MKKFTLTLTILAVLNISLNAYGQCKGFVKKSCIPKLSPFLFNGQLNATQLAAGASAETQMTFYSGQTYRVLVCGQSVLGTLRFKVKDASGNLIFDSEAHNQTDVWDFKSESTQQVTIEVIVPPNTSDNKIVPTGCVGILVGFKQAESTTK
jgi:hypothetical protein